MPELSILMPAYNEQDTIVEAVKRVIGAQYPVEGWELVVVENGSTDRTRAILDGREWPSTVKVVHVERNRGKGHAVRLALGEATGRYAAILDADLEYSPDEIGHLLEPLLEGKADAVFGTRMFQSHSAFGFWYVMGNRIINTAANILYNAWVSDILCCLKVMPTDTFRGLDLREDGFGIDGEIPARLLKRKLTIYEVPVTYRARSREEGKKLIARDGGRVLATLMRCRIA